MHNYQEASPHTGDKFGVLKYYPSHNPMRLILGYGIKNGAPSSLYTANNTMDVEYIKVWLRADCSVHKSFTTISNDWVGYDTWAGTVYEMGETVTASAGNSVTIPAYHQGIFAATNEVALLDGFGAENGSVFSAFITSCQVPAWDSKVINPSPQNHNSSNDSIHTSNSLPSANSNVDIIYSSEQINIKSKQNSIISYELFDAIGRFISSDLTNSLEVTLNKNNYADGIYYIKLKKEEGCDVKKIVIQN
jgi:hypothetical protein